MTDSHTRHARTRLDAALEAVAVVFHGATAHPEEYNCPCHWGSAEELALLKVPGVELDPDLLRRSWQAPDWRDHGSVLRRVLPQLAAAVVWSESFRYRDETGLSFARGRWQEWPREQASVLEPLRALLPHSGLAKGTVTEATDPVLLLALAAGPATAGRYAWAAAFLPVKSAC